MKSAAVFLLLLVASTVNAGGEEMKMMKKWMVSKAMEGCFGEKAIKHYMVAMKKATAKCSGKPVPVGMELDMFSQNTKVVQALMSGAKDMMHSQMTQTFVQPQTNGMAIPTIAIMTQPQQQTDPMADLMKKFMMMKMFKKMTMGMGHGRFGHRFGDDDDDEEKDMMMEAAAFSKQEFDEDSPDEPSMNEIMSLLRNAMKGRRNRNRNRRAASEEGLMKLGEKLNSTLKMMKESFEAKQGNMSCVLQEVGMINADMELDLDSMMKHADKYGIEDPWLEENLKKNAKLCYADAEATPQEVLDSCVFGPKWSKIKKFCQCHKKGKFMLCMANDIRKKLEANFMSMEEMEKETGLEEKYLLTLAASLVQKEMAMYDP